MSFTINYGQTPTFLEEERDADLTQCNLCDFECGTIGYCLKDCGEQYIINELFTQKGYKQVNLDWFMIDDLLLQGLELYSREAVKLQENLQRLGYSSTIHHHPLQKNYLRTIIIDGYNPIDLSLIFLKLDVIK